MIKISWQFIGGYAYGCTTTKSGLTARVAEVQRSRTGKHLFSLYIEGDERNACTRATIEKVEKILESR